MTLTGGYASLQSASLPVAAVDEEFGPGKQLVRKGALATYRDATLFKVMYEWGLRRTETSKLDLADWGRNPAAPEFGRYGMLNVRYGKAKKGSCRGGGTWRR